MAKKENENETNKINKYGAVGFLDSGVGGISVLNEALQILPNENYIFFGDSANAPYGTKDKEEVRKLTEDVVEKLADMGAKAVVIACNTATGVAADYLRKKYKYLPIIGIEPALKPAALEHEHEKIIVMATPRTLVERKFANLMQRYEKSAEIIPVPCGGLMEFVEAGKYEGEEVEDFLRELLKGKKDVTAAVLGCTHYPFLKNSIRKILGSQVEIYDGGAGTARQLKRRLSKLGLLNDSEEPGKVTVINSSKKPEMIELSKILIGSRNIEIWQ